MSETTTETAKAEQPSEKPAAKKPGFRPELILNGRLPFRIAYFYLAIPMYIFMFGWMKLPLALLFAALMTGGLYLACKDAPEMDAKLFRRDHMMQWVGVVVIAGLWVYLAGIGEYAYQNFDHMWRNAILEKLVNSTWPVTIEDPGEYFEKPVAMIYYFAIWMPAAVAGKLWGLKAAHAVLFLWCTLGVALVFAMLIGLQNRVSPWIAVAFIFFSGMDTVGDFILNNAPNFLWFANHHIEYWISGFQFSSLTTQLFWVYNQAIPAWLITTLLLHQKDNRSVIFIYSFSFLSCTLPAIGMLPILAYLGISRIVRLYDKTKPFKANWKPICADALTFQNIASGLSLTLLSYLFLKVNTTGTSGFRWTRMQEKSMNYLLFVALEFVVYFIAIYSTQGRKPIFWVSLITLLVCPLIACGSFCDFMMRASIPGLVVLFTLIMDGFEKLQANGSRRKATILLGLYILGGFTAYHEISRTVITSVRHGNDPNNVAIVADELDLLEEVHRGNFYGEYEDSIFFRIFAKKP